IVVALDQLTKQAVLWWVGEGRGVDVIDDILSIRVTLNPGGAFGLGRSFPALFLVATVVIVAVLFLVARRTDEVRWLVPLGLVLGGGLGNLCDRLFRATGGRVIDFVDFHVWPVFNLADSAIVSGVILMLILSFRTKS
ncbi:MAG TPA: signal peptidase II, partial [Actinomycetota bacterium]|nr:signal peptidase II [Actinomycetota bacterium]